MTHSNSITPSPWRSWRTPPGWSSQRKIEKDEEKNQKLKNRNVFDKLDFAQPYAPICKSCVLVFIQPFNQRKEMIDNQW